MHCPSLADLPAPPAGRTGWPWTVETPPLPPARQDGSSWPRISIVTPSDNQGQFIEETIRSVLLQGYPDLEYIIMDGGSTDDSVGIIRKYERWLTHWESEKDRGQAHAINKGIDRSTGVVFQWINSDDYLMIGALQLIGSKASEAMDLICCGVTNFGVGADEVVANRDLTVAALISLECSWHQPGVWLRLDHTRALGGFPENYDYAFDWYFTIRYLERFPVAVVINETLVNFRLHATSKSVSHRSRFANEQEAALSALSVNSKTAAVRIKCRRVLERRQWTAMLGCILNGIGVTPGKKLALLSFALAGHPSQLATRMTLGAVRRLLVEVIQGGPARSG